MAGKKLGIIITKYENLDHISGITKAARAAGHRVQIFMTDEGIRFTTDPKFKELLKISEVSISCCDHSCELLHVAEKTEGITYGSQYNHATLLHDSDRALIF
jgi:peroxiredoxin family protein